jgi:hypothetical protein
MSPPKTRCSPPGSPAKLIAQVKRVGWCLRLKRFRHLRITPAHWQYLILPQDLTVPVTLNLRKQLFINGKIAILKMRARAWVTSDRREVNLLVGTTEPGRRDSWITLPQRRAERAPYQGSVRFYISKRSFSGLSPNRQTVYELWLCWSQCTWPCPLGLNARVSLAGA